MLQHADHVPASGNAWDLGYCRSILVIRISTGCADPPQDGIPTRSRLVLISIPGMRENGGFHACVSALKKTRDFNEGLIPAASAIV